MIYLVMMSHENMADTPLAYAETLELAQEARGQIGTSATSGVNIYIQAVAKYEPKAN